ncbi:MAG: hypothetical protein R3F62_08355 [Planctomycetota bacterium]
MLRPPLVTICVCLAAAGGALAQQKPAFRNGQAVEAQGPDGRWYAGKVWKVTPGNPPEYEIRFDGMPSDARQVLPEPKLRAPGGGPVVDPEAIKAVIAVKQLFQQVVAHGKQGQWQNERWNRDLDALTDRFEAGIKAIQERWPEEPLGNLPELPAKLRANTDLRRKEAGAAAEQAQAAAGVGAALEAFYRGPYEAAKNFPATISPGTLKNQAETLEQLDLAAVLARIAEDAKAHPEVFAYYGMQNPQKYGDMPYGGQKRPQIADKDLDRVNRYYLPTIYEVKARLAGKDQELADAVPERLEGTKTLDEALAAVRLAKAIARCQPQNPHLPARLKEAQAVVEERLAAIKPLIKGPFHVAHMRELVGFSTKQTLGSERQGDVVTEITPGQPFYLVGYLSESVASLGFKRRDSTLGYETTRLPDVKFQIQGQSSQPWRLAPYSTVTGKDLEGVGVVVVDLLPDPQTTYPTHLAYLPALHFTRWLLDQKPGTYTLEFSANPHLSVDFTAKGAHGRFQLTLTEENRPALQAYYDALWAKKLSTVVFPDDFGVEDDQGNIPNLDHLKKYGRLIKLTCAETNKVMKPFPNQHQVDNYVGMGFGLFEREGRYEIIPLGFSRKPSAQAMSWTSIRGKPDHYALRGPTEYTPRLIEFGYEIPQANLDKTGSW